MASFGTMVRAFNEMDSEFLISLVEARPILWDRKANESRKEATRKELDAAWNEVCARMKKDFDDMDDMEQSAYQQTVMKKWTNLRDSYAKYLRKLKVALNYKKRGVKNLRKVAKYRFADKLAFLRPTYADADLPENLEGIEDTLMEDESPENNTYADYFDNHHLISLVKARPVLWDKRLACFKAKRDTQKAWNEVFTELKEDYEYMESYDKKIFRNFVRRRWSILLDRFLKFQYKLQRTDAYKKTGIEPPNNDKFLYNDRMQFIKPAYDLGESSECIPDPVNNQNNICGNPPPPPGPMGIGPIGNPGPSQNGICGPAGPYQNPMWEHAVADFNTMCDNVVRGQFVICENGVPNQNRICPNPQFPLPHEKPFPLPHEKQFPPPQEPRPQRNNWQGNNNNTTKTTNKKRASTEDAEPKKAELKNTRPESSNPHTAFFQSLLPHLNTLNSAQTLEFQMFVLEKIKEVQVKRKRI